MTFVTRFAPSPTGYLHLGHAYAALTASRLAQEHGGRFVLRIEDIDTTRCKPVFETAIYDDLSWLGLEWEMPVRRQSDHFEDYTAALQSLITRELVYRCFKTRKDIAEDIARAPHGSGADVYRGPDMPMSAEEEAERLARGEIFAWRLSLARCRDTLGADYERLTFRDDGKGPQGETGDIRARPDRLGDVILGRKDVGTSYHLAVTHDDALQGITHVVRGVDLFEATHLHRLLQALMNWPAPIYHHHKLLTDARGKRFAKRDKAVTLRALRESGMTPGDVFNRIGMARHTS